MSIATLRVEGLWTIYLWSRVISRRFHDTVPVENVPQPPSPQIVMDILSAISGGLSRRYSSDCSQCLRLLALMQREGVSALQWEISLL